MEQFHRVQRHRHTLANHRGMEMVWENWNDPTPSLLENSPEDYYATIVNTVSLISIINDS